MVLKDPTLQAYLSKKILTGHWLGRQFWQIVWIRVKTVNHLIGPFYSIPDSLEKMVKLRLSDILNYLRDGFKIPDESMVFAIAKRLCWVCHLPNLKSSFLPSTEDYQICLKETLFDLLSLTVVL